MAEDDNQKKISDKSGATESPDLPEMQYDVDAADIKTFHALSRGPMFIVYTGVYKNKRVAVKVSQGSALVDDEKEIFVREVEILKRVNHSNIVKFIGATVEDGNWMMIVFELVENSYDVQQYLKSDKAMEYFQLDTVVTIALLASKAMEYLHSQGIIHGNICSENVLIAPHAVKLTGFSEAKELLVDEEGTKQLHKKDVFDFGNLLNDLLEGFKVTCLLDQSDSQEDDTPQPLLDLMEAYNEANMPKPLVELMEACISEDPNDRPEFTVIREKFEIFWSSTHHEVEFDLGDGDYIPGIPILSFDEEMLKSTHDADSKVDVPVSKKKDSTLALPGASIHRLDIPETTVKTRGKASTEQMVGGTLEEYMLELKPNVLKDKTAIIRLALGISEAMQQLHAKGITRRNLNSSHVFLTKSKGFLCLGGHEEASEEKPHKIEPEHFKADVYSFSQILWELLTNNHTPFQAYASSSKKEKKPILEGVPDEVLELLISCGSEKAEERPDFTQITATLTNLLNKRTPQLNFNRKLPALKIKN